MNNIVNADMREFWNGEGGEKWLRFQETMDANILPFGQKAMSAAAISLGESVLDIGCGCGDTSFEIARHVGPDGRVLGVDISEPILARAKARSMSTLRENVAFECGDAQVLSFEAAAFDLIFSRFGVMFFEYPTAAFGNLKQALKSGGRLTFVCWQPANENEWIRAPLELVSHHVPLPTPPDPDEPGPLSFGDPGRVKRILTNAGYSDIAINRFDTPFTLGGSVDEAVAFLTQMGPTSGAIVQSGVDDTIKSRIAADLHDMLMPRDTGVSVTMDSASWIVTAYSA